MYINRVLILFLLGSVACGCIRPSTNQLDETFIVRHEGADMPVHVHGDARNNVFILVLHGAGSYGLAFRDGAFTEQLEDEYVMVYYDQRGQSMSQGHYTKPSDVVELMAEDVVAVTQVLRDKYGDDITLFLMGHSWGGALSAAVLTTGRNQDYYAGWINVDGVHDFPLAGSERKDWLLEIADAQMDDGILEAEWEAVIEALEPLDEFDDDDYVPILRQAKVATDLLYRGGTVEPTVSGEKLQQAIFQNNPITWFVSDAFNRPFEEARDMELSFSDQLREVTIPALLIWGLYDVSVPPTVGKDCFERLGSLDKSLHTLESSIHHPHDTEPDRFAELVMDFVETHK